MKDQFIIQELWDLSWNNCIRYANLFFPFGNLQDWIQVNQKDILSKWHMDLMNKYTATQNKINEYIEFRKVSIKKIDDELWEYLKKDLLENTIPSFNWTNPSYKLKNDFIEIIELCALRLQDLARLCLQVTEQQANILQKQNLVVEYEKLLKEWYWWDDEFMQSFNADHQWIKMIKELRNEAWRHQWWDKNWRELIFHDIKVDINNWGSPVLHIPAFDFTGSEWQVRIDDFEEFFDILMHNIFDLSIDRLWFAYAKQSNTPRPIIKMMIEGKRIEDEK